MKPKNKIEPWLFAAPALVIYVFIVILPILWSLTYSFTDWNGIGKLKFIGLDNYVKLFSDKTLWIAFKNNIFFMIRFLQSCRNLSEPPSFPVPDISSSSATSRLLKPESLHTSPVRPGVPKYLRKETTSTVPVLLRCSVCP